MININKTPYKIVFEGSYNNIQFELEIFNDTYYVAWLEYNDFESQYDVEQEIYEYYIQENEKGIILVS